MLPKIGAAEAVAPADFHNRIGDLLFFFATIVLQAITLLFFPLLLFGLFLRDIPVLVIYGLFTVLICFFLAHAFLICFFLTYAFPIYLFLTYTFLIYSPSYFSVLFPFTIVLAAFLFVHY